LESKQDVELFPVNFSGSINPISPSLNPPPTPTKCKRTSSLDGSDIFQTPKYPLDIHESIEKPSNLTQDQRTVSQKANKALGQLTAEQAKLKATNRRLENQLEAQKVQGLTKKAKALGQIEEEELRASDELEKAKIESPPLFPISCS
jgi:hypothetical protein